jgi:hypothetical protein
MRTCGFLRRLVVLSMAALAVGAAAAHPAGASTGCSYRPMARHFLPWLDPAYYTLAPNGGLEGGSAQWSLRGGAKVVAGNERFYVRAYGDKYSLYLPSGSSARTSTTCVEVLDGTMRLFARNTGSLLSTLKVEVLFTDVFGTPRAATVGLLVGTARWQPTLPLAFFANLLHPPLLTDGKVDVAFRFTPQGRLSGWRIDDVYVDPFKGS